MDCMSCSRTLHYSSNRKCDSEAGSFPVEWMEHMLLCKSTAGRPGLQICFWSLCVAIVCTVAPTGVWMISSATWRSTRDVIYAKGEGQFNHMSSPPLLTDHFTYPRQVNPFIVMKWGGIMYCECEMLNPVLAFLWGRSSPADIENRDLGRRRNYQSKHDADIAQHTLKEICMCVCASRQTPHISTALSCTCYCVALDQRSGVGCTGL